MDPTEKSEIDLLKETTLMTEPSDLDEIDPNKLILQALYDLRETTGFVSGTDLHDIFSRLNGDPSPSGMQPLDLEDLKRVSPESAELLLKRTWTAIPPMAKYVGLRGPIDEPMYDTQEGTLRAQVLYDLRGLTGYISGTDLHRLFAATGGEPSPSGFKTISVADLAMTPLGRETLSLLNTPIINVVRGVCEYTDERESE